MKVQQSIGRQIDRKDNRNKDQKVLKTQTQRKARKEILSGCEVDIREGITEETSSIFFENRKQKQNTCFLVMKGKRESTKEESSHIF